jgi:phage shock protein PspC (stress-responsive transcriptional regulator)
MKATMEDDAVENQERVPCPYCREMILPDAIKCKECGSTIRRKPAPAVAPRPQKPPITATGTIWVRNLPERRLFGVAACLAHNLRISVTLVRIIFVIATFFQLAGLFAYIALLIVIPFEPGMRSWFEKMVDWVSMVFNGMRRPYQPASGPAAGDVASNSAPSETKPETSTSDVG